MIAYTLWYFRELKPLVLHPRLGWEEYRRIRRTLPPVPLLDHLRAAASGVELRVRLRQDGWQC